LEQFFNKLAVYFSEKCNVAEEVDCQLATTAPPTTVPPPTTAQPTTEAPGEITCPADGLDYLPDPTDCQKYYLCVNGNPIPQICADGLLYDAVESE